MVTKPELDKILVELNKILANLDKRLEILEAKNTKIVKSQAKDLTNN